MKKVGPASVAAIDPGLKALSDLYGIGGQKQTSSQASPWANGAPGDSTDEEETDSTEGEEEVPRVGGKSKVGAVANAQQEFMAGGGGPATAPGVAGQLPGSLGATAAGSGPAPAAGAGAGPGGVGTQNDMTTLVQVQMLELMRKMSKKQRRGGSSDSSDSDSAHSDDGLGAAKSGPKGMRGLRRMHRRIRKKPAHVIRSHIAEARRQVGVASPGEVFHCKHYSATVKPKFGKMRGLFRIHLAVSYAIHVGALEGKPVEALALMCQLQKAIEQATLDGGKWNKAQWHLPHADPFYQKGQAGSFQDVAAIAGYMDVMAKLRNDPDRSAAAAASSEDSGPKQVAPKPRSEKAKGKKKGKGDE